MTAWCILRTGGSRTIRLADALLAYGAWTPRETICKRLPRRRAKACNTHPIMPTFIFAPAEHLPTLIALAQAPAKQCPDFSVQRYYDKYPLIADAELNPLRLAERAGTPLEALHRYSKGDSVKLTAGGFQGLTGIIETDNGKHAMVCFPGFAIPVKISTLQLLPESITHNAVAA